MEGEGTESSSAALPAEPAARVHAILERVVQELDIDAKIAVEEGDEEIVGSIEGDDLGTLIGRRGQTIDSLQLICYRAAFQGRQDRKRVTVDAAGYRARRREIIERQADRAAERAISTGKEIELEAMSPTERRVVHQHLKERAGLETFSEGEEPDRRVIVAPLVSD